MDAIEIGGVLLLVTIVVALAHALSSRMRTSGEHDHPERRDGTGQ